MKHFSSINDDKLHQIVVDGGIGVLRTDTLYGMVAKANNEAAVQRVYDVKKRSPDKSPIVLVASLEQLLDVPSAAEKMICKKYWPGKTSIILATTHAPSWLQRGNKSVAYRIPDNEGLCQLLKVTGPLIAPSANFEGSKPARNIAEAEEYFGDTVDFYVDGGWVEDDSPSKLVRINSDGSEEYLR